MALVLPQSIQTNATPVVMQYQREKQHGGT